MNVHPLRAALQDLLRTQYEGVRLDLALDVNTTECVWTARFEFAPRLPAYSAFGRVERWRTPATLDQVATLRVLKAQLTTAVPEAYRAAA